MKKVCIFTSTRADYGLFKPLLDELKKEKSIKLQLLVSGSHLSEEFGYTYKEIINDGFPITEKVKILPYNSSTKLSICNAMSKAMKGYASAFTRMHPDILVVLGDRYETFICAAASTVLNIPVAHIHGGETTQGAIDEAFRHSITKMSHLHFTSTDKYKKRVIQLGESPKTVYNVGALGIDNIKKLKLLSKYELEQQLNIKLNRNNFLITYHPVTLEKMTALHQIHNLLDVLKRQQYSTLIFTKANADPEGILINKILEEFCNQNSNAYLFSSLGQLRYLSLMSHVNAIIGNSSSGIIEAPSLKVATINIGDRQKGRIKVKSIIECNTDVESIQNAFSILNSESFKRKVKQVKSPYGDGKTAEKIKKIILKCKNIELKKTFFNIGFKI
jgi:GDP/UDP-N,N'-diacetylbacillosamine 2-epimerase (hydrolysing)